MLDISSQNEHQPIARLDPIAGVYGAGEVGIELRGGVAKEIETEDDKPAVDVDLPGEQTFAE